MTKRVRLLLAATLLPLVASCTLHASGSEARLDDLTRRIGALESRADATAANFRQIGEWSARIEARVPPPENEGDSR